MKIAVYDTETTGFVPKRVQVSTDTAHLFPHAVQLSYVMFETDTNTVLKTVDHIIRLPTDIPINEESVKIHGITREISTEKGVDICQALTEFFLDMKEVDLLIAHNFEFDWAVVQVECCRHGIELPSELPPIYCTMKETTAFCKLPSQFKKKNDEFKWPTLFELYVKLFNEVPEKMHNSLYDVYATLRCVLKFKFGIDFRIVESLDTK